MLLTPAHSLDHQPFFEGRRPVPDPTQSGLDPIRVALDHGEVVELDARRQHACLIRWRGIPVRGAPAGALACVIGGSGTAGVVVSVADISPLDPATSR